MERFSYKGRLVDVDIRVSSQLKEELAWAASAWVASGY